MSFDISDILADWPYERGQIAARKIVGDDGKEKIQLRLDLGLLQMEVSGHPGGLRPHGYETLLDYYEHLLDRYRQEGSPDQFSLDPKDCEELRNEGIMYYHRYLAEFILKDYEAAIRDTTRNLRLMDFCSAYAREESDRAILEQHRPYVIMMRTRASGLLAVREDGPEAALRVIRNGMEEIEDSYRHLDPGKLDEGTGELAILRALVREIEEKIPPDPVTSIKRELALAVKEERYEDAAGLRDQLRNMTGDEDVDSTI